MSEKRIKIEFRNDILQIVDNNPGKYYIHKIIELDENNKPVKKHIVEATQKPGFAFRELGKNAKLLSIHLKTDSPLKGIYAPSRTYKYTFSNKRKARIVEYRPSSGEVEINTWPDSLWIDGRDEIDKMDFYAIIDFFLINAPSAWKSSSGNQNKQSRRSINVYDYWGEECFTSHVFKREFTKHQPHQIIGLFDKNMGFASNMNDMQEKLQARDLYSLSSLESFDMLPRIAMVDSQSNRFLSFLRHIRNAFAHGSFLFHKGHLIFQDQSQTGKIVTGRGVVKVETLLFIKVFVATGHVTEGQVFFNAPTE